MAAETPHKPRLEWKRLKVLGYAVALVAMSTMLFYNISTRKDTEVTVLQVRQPLFVVLSDGSVRNRYQINIVNKTATDQIYHVSVEDIPNQALDMGSLNEFKVRAGESIGVNAKVNLEYEQAEHQDEFKFIVSASNQTLSPIVIESNFSSPHD
jgi:polyferredoxin